MPAVLKELRGKAQEDTKATKEIERGFHLRINSLSSVVSTKMLGYTERTMLGLLDLYCVDLDRGWLSRLISKL